MAPIIHVSNSGDTHDQTELLIAYKERETVIIEATAATNRVARYLGEKVFNNENALKVIGLVHEVPNNGASLESDFEGQNAKISFGANPLTHIIATVHFPRTGRYFINGGSRIHQELKTTDKQRYTSVSAVDGFIPVSLENGSIRFYPVRIFPQSEIFFPDRFNYAVASFEGNDVVYWASPLDGAAKFDCTETQLFPTHTLWLAYTDAKVRDHNFSNVPGAFINPDPDFMRGVVKGLYNAYPEEFNEREEVSF